MAKYRYMLRGIGYGGELVVGTVSEAFVRYWAPITEEDGDGDLIDTLYEDSDDFDEPDDALLNPETAPVPTEDYEPGAWYELDDLEHISSTFADSYVEVYQIDDNDEEIDGTAQQFNLAECYPLYSRECYFGEEQEDTDSADDDIVPVLSVLSSEKGGFWNAIIETDEPFDIELVAVGNLETNLCELTDAVFYDGKMLEFEYDFADTSGKGTYAGVGWLNRRWHDTSIDDENMQYALSEWRESLED